jgi:hypothetical protein
VPRFPCQPTEKRTFEVNFKTGMNSLAGEVVSSAEVTALDPNDVDATTSVVSAYEIQANTKVVCLLDMVGATIGTYNIKAVAATSLGQVLEQDVFVDVEEVDRTIL